MKSDPQLVPFPAAGLVSVWGTKMWNLWRRISSAKKYLASVSHQNYISSSCVMNLTLQKQILYELEDLLFVVRRKCFNVLTGVFNSGSLSYRPASLCSLAGGTTTLCRSWLYPPIRVYEFGHRYDNPITESTICPQSGLWIRLQVRQPYAGIDFICQSGSMNSATGTTTLCRNWLYPPVRAYEFGHRYDNPML